MELRGHRAGTAVLSGALFAGLTALLPGAAHPQAQVSARSREDAADKATFEIVCGVCHASTIVDDIRAEPDWRATVEQMASIGARGTEDQFARVMRYLLRNFTRVNVNTATAAQMAPVLDISETTAQAVVRYRAAKGEFKTLEDLKKVPGLNAARLDARKDRIAF